MGKRVELLSPVGTWEALTAAVNCGADAVYFGGRSFNARQQAANFSDEDLKRVIDYCHLRGVLVRIALNILYKEKEINEVLSFAALLYEYGADALIIQDIGLASIIKKHLPNIKLHASTQLTVHNLAGVKFMENAGFSRIVLSRELSLSEIKNIANQSDAEIECFVHGALCVSYSGRCFMSSFIGNRSGNRGRCAQPCRMIYDLYRENKKIKGGFLLSPCDISTIKNVNELISAGISTFKIEGRMKSAEYAAAVTSTYRYAIDTGQVPSEASLKELTQIFNRGGHSTSGYYNNWAGADMMSLSPKSSGIRTGTVENYNYKSKKCTIKLNENLSPGDGIEIWTKDAHTGTNISKAAKANDIITIRADGKINKGDLVYKSFDKLLDTKLKRFYSKDTRQQSINADFSAEFNKPVRLTLSTDRCSVTAEISPPQPADNQPLTRKSVVERLSKTGDTPFSLVFDKVNIEDNIYIPISELNALKRNALRLLELEIIKAFSRDKVQVIYSQKSSIIKGDKKITVSVFNVKQLEAALKFPVSRVYIEMTADNIKDFDYALSLCHSNKTEMFFSLPYILRDTEYSFYYSKVCEFEKTDLDGYLIRNYGFLPTSKKIVSDYTFNIFNSCTLDFVLSFSDTAVLSPELTFSELSSIKNSNSEVIIYGSLPVMTTHQCPVGNYDAKREKGRFCRLKGSRDKYYLRDRMNEFYPVIRNCDDCFCQLLSSKPIFLPDSADDILKLPSEFLRLCFTEETAEFSEKVLALYFSLYKDYDLKNANSIIEEIKSRGYTKGHFYKQVL